MVNAITSPIELATIPSGVAIFSMDGVGVKTEAGEVTTHNLAPNLYVTNNKLMIAITASGDVTQMVLNFTVQYY